MVMSMVIYPAVDIRDGKCVRLRQGRFDDMTVYYDNPLKAAEKWRHAGAEYLHVVDLDGARTGKQENLGTVFEIARKTGMKIQLGGGIRTMGKIETVLENGVFRVVLGTAVVKTPWLVNEAVKKYGKR